MLEGVSSPPGNECTIAKLFPPDGLTVHVLLVRLLVLGCHFFNFFPAPDADSLLLPTLGMALVIRDPFLGSGRRCVLFCDGGDTRRIPPPPWLLPTTTWVGPSLTGKPHRYGALGNSGLWAPKVHTAMVEGISAGRPETARLSNGVPGFQDRHELGRLALVHRRSLGSGNA